MVTYLQYPSTIQQVSSPKSFASIIARRGCRFFYVVHFSRNIILLKASVTDLNEPFPLALHTYKSDARLSGNDPEDEKVTMTSL